MIRRFQHPLSTRFSTLPVVSKSPNEKRCGQEIPFQFTVAAATKCGTVFCHVSTCSTRNSCCACSRYKFIHGGLRMDFLRAFFSSNDFMPHGYCYLWNARLVWLHVVS